MLSPAGVPAIRSPPSVPNSVATVAMWAGAHGATDGVTPAGGTGLPPLDESALVGAGPGEEFGGAGGGGAGRPVTFSQSGATRSTESALTVSLPSPHVTTSDTSPLVLIVSSPALPLMVSTPLLPVSTSGPDPPLTVSLPVPPDRRLAIDVELVTVSLRSPTSTVMSLMPAAGQSTRLLETLVQPAPATTGAFVSAMENVEPPPLIVRSLTSPVP